MIKTKEKIIVLVVAFMALIFTSNAHAASLMYIKAQLGLPVVTDGSIDGTDINTDFDPPYPITLGFGVFISPLASLALEVNYETAKIDDLPASMIGGSDDTKQFGALLNLYFHFPSILKLEPFIGTGLGYSLVTIRDNDYKGDGFVWQLSAGLDFNLKDFLALTAEARFLEPLKIDLEDGGGVDVGQFDFTHARLMVGLKFKL